MTFTRDVTAVYVLCRHFFCVPSSSKFVPRVVCGAKEPNEVCCVFLPCVPPEAPDGILIEGGRDKRENDWANGPMPLSIFTFSLHQALFWGQAKNLICQP